MSDAWEPRRSHATTSTSTSMSASDESIGQRQEHNSNGSTDRPIDRFKRTNERTNEPPDESWERMRSFEHERRCHRLRCESWSASDSEGRRDSRSVACSRDTARAASLEPRRPPRRSHGSLRTASAAARESREHCWDPRKSVARSWRASRAMTTTTKKHRTRRHWWRPTTPR